MSAPFTVFFDGACPLCRREINMIKRWASDGKLAYVDISVPDFNAAALGKSHEELMAEIHGRTADGEWITGVEVFRQIYAATWARPLIPVTRLPGISQFMNFGYRVFARNRLRLTGRCDEHCSIKEPPNTVVAEHPETVSS